jgi:outer membrane protein TolC
MAGKLLLVCINLLISSLIISAQNQSRNLDYYLNEGLKNSPLLNDYRNQLSSATDDSLLIRAAKKPALEARSQLMYSPHYNNFGYDEVITDGGNYTAVMGVSQRIFNGSELKNRYEAVALNKRYVHNTSRISTTELVKIITGGYLNAFSDFKDLQFNKSFLGLFLKENEIVSLFVKSGVAKQTDYLALIVETQSQEILVDQLQSQYRSDLLMLNQLCGIDDSLLYDLEEPMLTLRGSPEISKNPSYIQFQIDSMRIENAKMAVDISYKPKISWFADAGFLTSNPWNFYQHFGYSAGVSLNIPVYDGKQKDLEKHKLGFNENSRKGYENAYKNQYYQQIRLLNDELVSLNTRSARMEDQLKISDQLVKSLKDQLEAGIILMTEYINAVKNFRTISRNLNLTNIRRSEVINEMNFFMTQ